MGRLLQFGTMSSTNTYASEHFDELANCDLIVAEEQTHGRGRLQREWYSPRGNVYASFVIKELFGTPFQATVISSLSVLATIRKCEPSIPAVIKWPNDILVNGKKICGVLCEGVIRRGELAGMICGMGINVNTKAEGLAGISQPATSIIAECRREVNVKYVAQQLSIFLNWYYLIGIRSADEIFQQWKNANDVIGKEVLLTPPDGREYSTHVLDIDKEGRLVVEGRFGGVTSFACGDIKIKQKEKTNGSDI